MPLGMRDVLAGFFALVRGLGGQRKRCELLVVLAGANFCVAAEEAHENLWRGTTGRTRDLCRDRLAF
jgi:hypothetical protein